MKKYTMLVMLVLIIFLTLFINAFTSKGLFYPIGIVPVNITPVKIVVDPIKSQIDLSEIPPFEIIDISKRMNLRGKTIIGAGLKYIELEENNHILLVFVYEDSNLSIDNNIFVNIEPSLNPANASYIELDVIGEIVSAELNVNENGGIYIFEEEPIEVPPKSRIYFDRKEGLRIDVPDNLDLIEYPNFLRYLINNPIKLDGENIILPNGEKVSGSFSYVGRQILLLKNDAVKARGVEVRGDNTKIFFDDRGHEGNSVSLGDKVLFSSSEDSIIVIDFDEKNPYAQIDKGDSFSLLLKEDSSAKIENRDAEGLIPKVITKGVVSIQENSKFLDYYGGDVFLTKPNYLGYTTTTPIELFILDKDGSLGMGKFYDGKTIKGHKIFVDNFNRMAVVPEDVEEYLSLSEGINTKFSSRLRYNYLDVEDFAVLFSGDGKILRFSGISKGNEDALVGKFRDYYDSLTPKMKSSLANIEFMGDTEFSQTLIDMGEKDPESTVAFATRDGRVIFRHNEDFDRDTFRHETAHQLHFLIKGVRTLESSEKTDDLLSRFEIIGEEKEEEINEFERRWREIVGKDYRVGITNMGTYVYSEEIGSEKFSFGPNYGFIRPYGNKNILEDVATFQEEINNPEFFSPLLDPFQPYCKIYRKKLDLLYEYEFISEEEYNAILEVTEISN